MFKGDGEIYVGRQGAGYLIKDGPCRDSAGGSGDMRCGLHGSGLAAFCDANVRVICEPIVS